MLKFELEILEIKYKINIYIIPCNEPITMPLDFIFLLDKNAPNNILNADINIMLGFMMFSFKFVVLNRNDKFDY